MLDALVANAFGAKVTPEDFIPGARKRSRTQTPEQQYEIIKSLHVAFGGDAPPESTN